MCCVRSRWEYVWPTVKCAVGVYLDIYGRRYVWMGADGAGPDGIGPGNVRMGADGAGPDGIGPGNVWTDASPSRSGLKLAWKRLDGRSRLKATKQGAPPMASHMRTDDTPTTERITAQGDEAGRHASSQVIDEGLHVEAQDVRSSRKYFYTPDKGKAARTKHNHHHHSGSTRKKGGCLKIFLIILGIILVAGVAIGGAGYVYGKQMYASARVVKGQASEALAKVDDLKGQITSGDYEGAKSSAQDLSNIAQQMQQETSSDLWKLASRVPVYGGDVQKVRTLAAVFQDLADNALIPVTDELSGLSFSAIVGTEGNIDVNTLMGLVSALNNVSDVIDRNAQTVDAMGEAKLDQINEPLQKVRNQLVDLNDMTQAALKIAPVLPDMLGANGQTKNYLIIAQSNAEIRATGGFAGAWGLMSVTDGKLELGDFASFGGVRPNEGYRPTPTEDEVRLFGASFVNVPSNANIMPDWPRAAELFKFYYGVIYDYLDYVEINGVIGIDPVFLQMVLARTGAVTASNGWEVNGENAAQILMNQVYMDIDTKYQDQFFAEVAKLAFKQFTSNIGSIDITGVGELLQEAASSRRFLVWMQDEAAEGIMKDLGVAGELSYDPTAPVLGVYVNDNSWSKISWYMDLRTSVSDASINGDGSKTYQVTTTIANTIPYEDYVIAPDYILGGYSRQAESERRDIGDMVTGVLLYAPAGGTISDVTFSDNCNAHDVFTSSYNGLQVVSAHVNTDYDETTTITYQVTTSSEAVKDLQVRMTPTGQTFE